MSYKKIIYSCLLAILLIGPVLQDVEARRGWGWHNRGFFGFGVGPLYYNGYNYPYYSYPNYNPYYYNPYYYNYPYYYNRHYYRPHYYNRYYYGRPLFYNRPAYYPTYRTYNTARPVYYQQPVTELPTTMPIVPSETSTVPSDIQGMRPYQMNAMITIRYVDLSKISDANKQRGLMQQRDAVTGLGNQFDAEYRKYEDMLQRNDAGLPNQEGTLRSIFESFKAQYENFVNAVNSQ